MTVVSRRFCVAAAVIVLALPAEAVVFRAISADEGTAIQEWVESLSNAELDEASASIQAYPFQYRRAILGALNPGERSRVWRDHLQRYLDDHPSLDPTAVDAIEAAIAVASPAAFVMPQTSVQEQLTAIGEQVRTILGEDEARYLLYWLGPEDGTFASIEPWGMKLANVVRGGLVALANGGDCECSTESDMCTGGCEEGDCEVISEFPMCGWFWSYECNGCCEQIEG